MYIRYCLVVGKEADRLKTTGTKENEMSIERPTKYQRDAEDAMYLSGEEQDALDIAREEAAKALEEAVIFAIFAGAEIEW